MYLFTTSTCPNCKMAKEMLAEEQYEVIDAERHPDLAAQYGIMQAPTLLVVEDGQAQKIVNASNIQKYVDEDLSLISAHIVAGKNKQSYNRKK